MLPHFPAYDQVNGARTSEQGTLPWLRRPAKWFIRKLACYLTGHKIPDLNTGLKAFKRDAMLPWLWVVPDGFSCVTTMTLAFLTNGYAVKYVPTPYRPRIGRSKFHPIKDTLSYLSTVLRMVLYFRPLKVFLPLSGVVIGRRRRQERPELPDHRQHAGIGHRRDHRRLHDLHVGTAGRGDRRPPSTLDDEGNLPWHTA